MHLYMFLFFCFASALASLTDLHKVFGVPPHEALLKACKVEIDDKYRDCWHGVSTCNFTEFQGSPSGSHALSKANHLTMKFGELWSSADPNMDLVLLHFAGEISEIALLRLLKDYPSTDPWKGLVRALQLPFKMPYMRSQFSPFYTVLESHLLHELVGEKFYEWAASSKLPYAKPTGPIDEQFESAPLQIIGGDGSVKDVPGGLQSLFTPPTKKMLQDWYKSTKYRAGQLNKYTAWCIKVADLLDLTNDEWNNYRDLVDQIDEQVDTQDYDHLITVEMKEKLKEFTNWMRSSKFFGLFPHFYFLWYHPRENLRLMLRTIFHLQPTNPFLKVDDLLSNVSLTAPLDPKRSVNFFGDAVGKFIPNIASYDVGGNHFDTVSVVLSSMLKLRHAQHQIPNLDELLRLLIIFHLSSMTTSIAYVDGDVKLFNEAIIRNMKLGDRVFLSGGTCDHGIGIEVIKRGDDKFLVTILNSGDGIQNIHFQPNKDIGRWVYFQQIILNLQEIKNRHFFTSRTLNIYQIYGADGEPTYPPVINPEWDTVSSQKRGVCYVKSVMYLIKWFLRDPQNGNHANYNWWKAWFLQDRASEILQVLKDTPISLNNWDALSEHWNLGVKKNVVLSKLPFPKNAGEAILIHQVMRLQGEAMQPMNAHVKDAMMQELGKIKMPEGLRKAFDLRL